MAKNVPQSRSEAILQSIIDDTPYNDVPQSRVEYLLLQLKGGGIGTDDYNELTNKPAINGNTLIGDMTAQDLGLSQWEDI